MRNWNKRGNWILLLIWSTRCILSKWIFKGINYDLIHYPDGEVHSPFQSQEKYMLKNQYGIMEYSTF